MTRKLFIALASIVPLVLAGGAVASHFSGSGHDRGGSGFTPMADTPTEPTDTTEAPTPPEPEPSEPATTTTTPQPAPTTTAPSAPAQPAQPVAQAPAPQQTAPQPTGPPSMTACVVIYGQRICQPYHPPSGRYPSGNSTAPNVTQYYPSVSKDPIRNPNIVHPRD
jgi:outer membrane biosynthesis protein TonB